MKRLKNAKPIKVPDDIKHMVEYRELLRQEKQWQAADETRRKINEKGFQVDDTPAGSVIKKLKK